MKRVIHIKFVISLLTICVLTITSLTTDVSAQTRQRKKTTQKTAVQNKNVKKNPKSSSEAKKRQMEIQKEIKQTELQIKENNAKVIKELADLGKLNIEIEETTAKIKEYNGKLSKLNGEIRNIKKSISTNEEDLSKLRGEYLKAVKKMRVTKKNNSDLAFIFSSKNLNEALRRMRYMKEFSRWRNRQTNEINVKIEDLNNQKEALSQMRAEQESALSVQKSNKDKLSVQHQKQENIVAELKKNGKTLENVLKKKQSEAKELDNLVSQLIAEEQRKAEEEARRKAQEEARRKAEEAKLLAQEKEKESKVRNNKTDQKKEQDEKKKNGKTEKPTEYADARKRTPRSGKNETGSLSNVDEGNFQEMRGKLPYPSTGSFIITSRFGRQYVPDMNEIEYDNPGIDAESDLGASARAVFKGKVSGVYILPGYNTVVIVNHGNYYTVYGNISSPSVKTGDIVESGTKLGPLAVSDNGPDKSSIHFEVWKNREKLNPQEWLR